MKKNIPGIYQVYTMHKPDIRRPQIIPDIHFEYTYSKLSRTFRYLSRDSLDMVYTKYIPSVYLLYGGSKTSRDRYRNVRESFE